MNMQKMLWNGQICYENASGFIEQDNLVSSTVFGYIAFKYVAHEDHIGGYYDAYLRPVDQDLAQTPVDGNLLDHPIVARSFACFPPVDDMVFTLSGSRDSRIPVYNRGGVTAYDVQESLAES